MKDNNGKLFVQSATVFVYSETIYSKKPRLSPFTTIVCQYKNNMANKIKYVKTEINFIIFREINTGPVDCTRILREKKQGLVYLFFLQTKRRIAL